MSSPEETLLLDKYQLQKQKQKTKNKLQVTFYFAEQIISTNTYRPIKNKGGYLFMPSPLEGVTAKRRKRKALIIVIVIFRDWLSIQLRYELEVLVPDAV